MLPFEMWAVIEHLKDPHLVLCIQEAFGISNVKKDFTNKSVKNEVRGKLTKINDSYTVKPNYSDESADYISDSDNEKKNYVVNNWLWYYIFVIGTELGDEIFYATFIPFWFWNIDGAVGRRVVMVWSIIMYVGQSMKDVVCWPRPSSPPVYRLQQKWAIEYGMPSTHAMVGVSIPFSVLLYTVQRYEYPVVVGFSIAVVWCFVISVSRIYLGMHTVLDVIVGILLAILLMVPLVPLVDRTDMFLLTSRWSPLILLSGSILILVFCPKSEIWTPTRGDTATVISVCVGIHLGAWANYQLGQMSEPTSPPPYKVIWPSNEMMGLIFLRSALGFSCILATRAICKSAGYATLCLLGLSTAPLDSPSSLRNTVDLIFKYITYILIGFNTVHLLPSTFKLLSIDRPTFYTEI